jgi:CelD/BcsL family acetyltransferase involved in cellulose biosynthesis
MENKTTILVDEEAFHFLSDERLLQEWRALQSECPWATAYQAPVFIKTWYETYRNQFTPVIVFRLGDDRRLDGLLTLAIRKSTAQMVHAGDIHCEYQVWLARGNADDSFICEALSALGKRFPRNALRLRYLPPLTRLETFATSRKIQGSCFLKPCPRPLINPDDEHHVDHGLRSKRVKLNRLKRLGPVSFHNVEKEEFPEIFEQAWPLYEFRQIGQFNFSRFLHDSDLKRFYLAVATHPDVLRMTVLYAGDLMIAWTLGMQGDGCLHLIAAGYSPFHARQSPAILTLLTVAKQLIRERRIFDLTPGDNFYKDQLATAHDVTHSLYFFPGPVSTIDFIHRHDLVRRAFKKFFRMTVRQPASLLARKLDGVPRVPAKKDPNVRAPSAQYRVHPMHGSGAIGQNDSSVISHKNKIADLLKYESSRRQPLQVFVNDARRLIDEGADVFTLVRNERLVAACWVNPAKKVCPDDSTDNSESHGISHLVRFYSHPAEDPAEMLRMCLGKWKSEIKSDNKDFDLCIAVPETDAFLNEQLGVKARENPALKSSYL